MVLELFTLAECWKGQKTLNFVVLILGNCKRTMHYKLISVANRSNLQIYLYYPSKDILMKTTPSVSYEREHGIVGVC